MIAPDFSLKDRTALITGSARGIGLGMAKAIASAGGAVAIHDIDLDVAESEAKKLRDTGARAIALGGDIADPATSHTVLEQTLSQLGGLHILINNAAIQHEHSWLACTQAEIEQEWRANLLAPILLCQRAVPIFIAQHWGRIINLGSIQQLKGNAGMLPYAMSKSALENMTRALAREQGRNNITVNMISPGWYNTHRTRDTFTTPEKLAEYGKSIPLGRIGDPQDVAGLTLLLCSEAGSYITGQTIFCDGGMCLK